jgi:hypothetical protein
MKKMVLMQYVAILMQIEPVVLIENRQPAFTHL